MSGTMALFFRTPAGKGGELADVRVMVNGEGVSQLDFPEPFNVAEYFIDRHLAEGRGRKVAVRAPGRDVTYAELHQNVNRVGNTLVHLGIGRGERVLMAVKDCPEFFFLFWGAIKIGAIPVPLNTMLRSKDFEFIIRDSECAALVCSPEFAGEIEAALAACVWRPRVTLRTEDAGDALMARAREASSELRAVPTHCDEDCFWLYSSGTTGQPKGVVHAHRDIVVTCHNYAVSTLGAREDDVFFSVPRLFFSYGMGCAMTFPLWVGGTVVLDERRPTPETVIEVFRRCAPTVFAAVPTFYASLLASNLLTRNDMSELRRCICGGEATPAELQRRWLETTNVPIVEGIGSTELLHIYISSRIDDIRPGATGKPVAGYQVRIVDDCRRDVEDGTPGRLLVKGQSLTRCYWNNPDKTAKAIVGGWFDTGDIYCRDKDGYYFYRGRTDDMLKVGGRWISPAEVEAVLVEHPEVLEAALVGRADESGLVKAEAWVVLRSPARPSDRIAEDLRRFCKSRLAPYKYPRWINFVDELPKTTTGKIQRYKLRAPSQETIRGA